MPFPILALIAAAAKTQQQAKAGKNARGTGGGLTPFQFPDTGAGSPNDLTAMLQQQAESGVVGSYAGGDPLAFQQRRTAELLRRRKMLLGGLAAGQQRTAVAPSQSPITINGVPTGGGGGFAQSQTSPYSSVYGYNPNTTFKF